jgi:hypothetical protein
LVRPALARTPRNPAGIVDITVSAGSIRIVGDADDNRVWLVQQPDEIFIGDILGDTQYRLNGGDLETHIMLPSPVTGGISISLGDGDDAIFVDALEHSRFLRINAGDGDNLLMLQNGITLGGNLSVTNGNGFDQTIVQGRVDVAGNLSIDNGSGESALTTQDGAELHVVGRLNVANGAGLDTISLDRAASLSAGGISIDHGDDSSSTVIAPAGGLTVNGDLSLAAGTGVDLVRIGSLVSPTSVSGKLAIDVGDGGGDIRIHGAPITLTGRLGVTAGIGEEIVDIWSADTKGTIFGRASVRLGAGEFSHATLTNLSVGALQVVGSVIYLNSLEVKRGTTIATGATNDSVTVISSSFHGSFSLSTGAGVDQISLANRPFASTVFHGKVRVRTGDGNDSVKVGEAGAEPAIATFGGNSFWDGGAGSSDRISFADNSEFNGWQLILVGFE